MSPIGLMVVQSENMKKETGIDIKDIEPEYEFSGLQASKSASEYWHNLGSSKNKKYWEQDHLL